MQVLVRVELCLELLLHVHGPDGVKALEGGAQVREHGAAGWSNGGQGVERRGICRIWE